jgi:hypothetical protein
MVKSKILEVLDSACRDMKLFLSQEPARHTKKSIFGPPPNLSADRLSVQGGRERRRRYCMFGLPKHSAKSGYLRRHF